MDEETELRNPFPSPPSHYTNYTAHNLRLLSLLRERAPPLPTITDGADPNTIDVDNAAETIDVRRQYELLPDQKDVPDFPLTSLEPPRVDWILDEGHYNVFGDTWFVKEQIPSLAELGGHQLYPADPATDRRPALVSVLRSMLITYSALTKSLLAPPPPPYSDLAPDWQRHVEWLTVLSQNLMAAANDLRPVQARVNLESMMRRQLDLRKEETAALHAKCDVLEARLAELRGEMRASTVSASPGNTMGAPQPSAADPPTEITLTDVLKWAEEIGG